jgi:Lrp/AsnC family leucine-responsive transcriptional regulator
MTQQGQLDKTDIRILDILQRDAGMHVNYIASKVYKSPTATHERIRKMKERGVIKQCVAVLDRRLIGRPTLMITLVKLNQHAAQTLREFPAYMYALKEVQVCMHLSGEFDFLLQVSLRDAMEYEQFLDEKLCCLPMVDKVRSSLVLRECKNYSPFDLEV